MSNDATDRDQRLRRARWMINRFRSRPHMFGGGHVLPTACFEAIERDLLTDDEMLYVAWWWECVTSYRRINKLVWPMPHPWPDYRPGPDDLVYPDAVVPEPPPEVGWARQ